MVFPYHHHRSWPSLGRSALRRLVVSLLLACMVWLAGWSYTLPAFALVQIELSDIDYHECPPDVGDGSVTSDGSASPARCFIVTGTAKNKTNKPVVNADVFGRIYDANGNPAMQNRTRLGSIAEIPPGASSFEIRISVAANQPTPLQLKQFKASGFTGTVRR